MRTKLLRKFRKRFNIVLMGGNYVLIDRKEKSVYSPFMSRGELSRDSRNVQIDFLVREAIISTIGHNRFNELVAARIYTRSVRFLNKTSQLRYESKTTSESQKALPFNQV